MKRMSFHGCSLRDWTRKGNDNGTLGVKSGNYGRKQESLLNVTGATRTLGEL
jgi:hypothetical protein